MLCPECLTSYYESGHMLAALTYGVLTQLQWDGAYWFPIFQPK